MLLGIVAIIGSGCFMPRWTVTQAVVAIAAMMLSVWAAGSEAFSLWRRLKGQRRKSTGACEHCGYSVCGCETCPECGMRRQEAAIEWAKISGRGVRSSVVFIGGIALLCLSHAFLPLPYTFRSSDSRDVTYYEVDHGGGFDRTQPVAARIVVKPYRPSWATLLGMSGRSRLDVPSGFEIEVNDRAGAVLKRFRYERNGRTEPQAWSIGNIRNALPTKLGDAVASELARRVFYAPTSRPHMWSGDRGELTALSALACVCLCVAGCGMAYSLTKCHIGNPENFIAAAASQDAQPPCAP
jgi:hypothetical protein